MKLVKGMAYTTSMESTHPPELSRTRWRHCQGQWYHKTTNCRQWITLHIQLFSIYMPKQGCQYHSGILLPFVLYCLNCFNAYVFLCSCLSMHKCICICRPTMYFNAANFLENGPQKYPYEPMKCTRTSITTKRNTNFMEAYINGIFEKSHFSGSCS